jgi:hypothetical protein
MYLVLSAFTSILPKQLISLSNYTNETHTGIRGKYENKGFIRTIDDLIYPYLGTKEKLLIFSPDTRQAMNVHRNIETRSRNQCYCGKAISITYSEYVCL